MLSRSSTEGRVYLGTFPKIKSVQHLEEDSGFHVYLDSDFRPWFLGHIFDVGDGRRDASERRGLPISYDLFDGPTAESFIKWSRQLVLDYITFERAPLFVGIVGVGWWIIVGRC